MPDLERERAETNCGKKFIINTAECHENNADWLKTPWSGTNWMNYTGFYRNPAKI